MRNCRIILADDHTLLREGLKAILSKRPGFEVIGEAGDGLELLRRLKQGEEPDVVILDISMPRLRGIEAIRAIKQLRPNVKVLVLTMHKDEDFMSQAFESGADGYLLKEDLMNELFSALDEIIAEKTYVSSLLDKEIKGAWLKSLRGTKSTRPEVLSSREKEVLKLVAEGASSKEIGTMLNISARTVDHHRAHIMRKLGLNGTTELIRYAITKGYTS